MHAFSVSPVFSNVYQDIGDRDGERKNGNGRTLVMMLFALAVVAVVAVAGIHKLVSSVVSRGEVKQAFVASQAGQSAFPCNNNALGSGWKLVRRVSPTHNGWHPATDHLRGSAVYGVASTNSAGTSTFSIQFNQIAFNQFLFTTGDCSAFVMAPKTEVFATSGTSSRRATACATSQSPFSVSQALWYNRPTNLEDPWISVVDHFTAIPKGLLVYGENNYNLGTLWSLSGGARNGANVYIRQYNGAADQHGCPLNTFIPPAPATCSGFDTCVSLCMSPLYNPSQCVTRTLAECQNTFCRFTVQFCLQKHYRVEQGFDVPAQHSGRHDTSESERVA